MDSRNRQAPPQPTAGRARLLEKLMAAVRPEFRASIYLPGPGDPVLGAGPCTVPSCDLPGKEHRCPHANAPLTELISVFGHVTRLPGGGAARLPA